MKKFYLFFYILFLTFLSFLCFCMKVNAKDMPVSPDVFYIDNQTSDPFTITLSGNSSANHTFNYANVLSVNDVNSREGDYFMLSVVSNKKINIKRRYDIGTHCSIDCWSNDSYLSLVSKNGSAYNYLFYFSKKLTRVTLGTQYITYEVHDDFTFTNLESGTATIYLYGAYASDNNPLPNVLENNASAINIIESGENNTNTIIDNDNDNTQDIIDNNNQNTQDIIDNLKSCHMSKNLYQNDYIYPTSSASIGASLSAGTYTLSLEDKPNFGNVIYIQLYKNNNLVTTSNHILNTSSSVSFSSSSYWYYFSNIPNGNYLTFTLDDNYQIKIAFANATSTKKVMLNEGSTALSYEPYGQNICSNKIDDTTNAVNGVTDSINGLNGTIQNGDIDNPNSDLDDISNMVAENGVITNLLSLPITLYSKILNSVNGTCSSYNLGQLYGTNITFSCISLQTLLGSTIWGVIDILFSGFTIYAIAKKMIKVFNNMSSLKEGDVIDD